MADTSNEQIRDALIRRQTRLIRTSTSISKDMRRLLSLLDGDIKTLIQKRTAPLTGTRVKFGKTRTARLMAIQQAIKEIQRPTYNQIRKEMKEQMVEIATLESVFVSDTITAALPVVVNLALPNSTLFRVIATSKPFQGKIMSKHISELEKKDTDRMMDAIRVGMVEGEGPDAITRRIFGTQVGATRPLTKKNVDSIVRTATNFIANQARQETYVANRNIIPEELYVATLDGSTTLQCMGLDGQVFPVGEGPVPPVHWGCRSTRVPHVAPLTFGTRSATAASKKDLAGRTKAEQRKIINDLTGDVPASESYQKFLKKQTAGFQNDQLGINRAKLFRKGGLQLDQFTDKQGKTITLKDLRGDHPEAFIKAGLPDE